MSKITKLRSEIDSITLQMIKLFKDRMEMSKRIGEIKNNLGIEITDEVREEKLRNKVISLCEKIHLNKSIGSKFLNYLLYESIKIQNNNKQNTSIFIRAKELESRGKNIIHMEVGEPDFQPPIIIKHALSEVYNSEYTKYVQAEGIVELRSAIARKFSTQHNCVKKDNVIICPGARFAIYLIMATILNNDDEIIIIDPSWSAYKDFAFNFGIKTRIVKTTIENNWNPDPNEIKKLINANTKMIVLNYPNNPTGKILPIQIQSKIIKIAIRNNLYILSDEIYSNYTYFKWKSIISYGYEKSMIVQSFSKSHSMTGFRIGYVIASLDIISKIKRLQALCLTNVSTPIQYAALKALSSDVSNNSKIIKSRLDLISKQAKLMHLNFMKPNGAMYIFIKLPHNITDSAMFSNKLLDSGLAVSPGTAFGNYKNFIRISVCCTNKQLIEGMNILNKVLDSES